MKFMTTSFGIKMISRFWLVLSALVLPIITMVSCDNSHSSSASNNAALNQVSASINAQDDEKEEIARISNDESKLNGETDHVDIAQDGQSLIASAKPHEGMSSLPSDNTLQATLMGDYGGVIPCTFCDDTTITLNLFADGGVIKTIRYNNPRIARVPLVESGIYRQQGDKITIAYDNQHTESYHIDDNHLLMINKNKNIDVNHALSRQ